MGAAWGRFDHVHLDRLFCSVESTRDDHLLACEFFRRFLIAKKVGIFPVVQHIGSVMTVDAGFCALGIVGSHLHGGVIASGTHAVCDDTCEPLATLRGYQDRKENGEAEDTLMHRES